MKKIIDVSTYNKDINWINMYKAGVAGSIIKIINKSLVLDDYFEKNYQGCNQSKIPWGVYNYSYATTTTKAISDMTKICDILDKIDKTYFQLGVWLDMEDACQKALSKAQNQAIIKSAKQIVENRGYTFGVYTGMSFYNTYIGSDCGVKNWWIARYPDLNTHPLTYDPPETKKPTVNNYVVAWQYTDAMNNPKVGAGNNGKADCSVLYSMPVAPAQIPITQTTKTGYPGTFPLRPARGYFKSGDKGVQVKYLQKLCNWFGSSISIDGEIGPKTIAAVKNMQKILGTTQDGEYGIKTEQLAKAYKK